MRVIDLDPGRDRGAVWRLMTDQRLSSALDLDELLRTICESAASLIGVRFVAFWLADEAARTLMLASGSRPDIALGLASQRARPSTRSRKTCCPRSPAR